MILDGRIAPTTQKHLLPGGASLLREGPRLQYNMGCNLQGVRNRRLTSLPSAPREVRMQTKQMTKGTHKTCTNIREREQEGEKGRGGGSTPQSRNKVR